MRHLLAITLWLLWLQAAAETFAGKVVGVSDGDTITVVDESKHQERVRLKGIDAPEKRQVFGEASKRNLSALVFGKDVSVEWDKRDRYGRIIGVVYIDVYIDDVDASLAQLEAGMAWVYVQFIGQSTPVEREAYQDAERQARRERCGLWQDKNPVPPWAWRKAKNGMPALVDQSTD